MTDKNTQSNLNNKDDKDDDSDDEKLVVNTDTSENKSSSKPADSDETEQTIDEAKTSHSAGRPWYKKLLANKKIAIPLAIILLLIIVLALPLSRYKILGLFWKQTYSLVVTDSQTNLPVSDATIQLAGKTTATDNQGHAKLKVAVGSSKLTVTKKYYKTFAESVVVGLKPKADVRYRLVATGRQVPLSVVNVITGKPIGNIDITAIDTSGKTDKNGRVTIVLPADRNLVAAVLSGSGYNNLNATIKVTSDASTTNTFKLTPSGHVYFLSNASGKIDVVKANLDGTGRQTILAGTGNENPNNTSLLASRDWKYLALQSVRDTSGNDQLNLVDTSNDQVTNIDKGNASFTPVGWSGDKFVYTVNHDAYNSWQPNKESLKSFDAVAKKITVLFQTSAAGSDNFNYVTQELGGAYLINDQVVYAINWRSDFSNQNQIDSNGATLNSINPDGTNKKVLKTFKPTNSTTYVSINLSPYDEPNSLAIDFYDNFQDNYYAYENRQFTQPSDLNFQSFYGPSTATTYLESPSGSQTFWAEQRDGKNTLLVGDADGNNGKPVATLSDYTTFGWYTDNYLLVEKNGSELYIMPASGGTALKVSDYYKPPRNFNGYGGGYGGL